MENKKMADLWRIFAVHIVYISRRLLHWPLSCVSILIYYAYNTIHSQLPIKRILKTAKASFPSRQSVFSREWVCIGPRQESWYGPVLGFFRKVNNTRIYSLVQVIENDCIVTQTGIHSKIYPEPSEDSFGMPSGFVLCSGYILPSIPPLATAIVKFVLETILNEAHSWVSFSWVSSTHALLIAGLDTRGCFYGL